MPDINEGAFSASEESAPQEEKPKKDKRRRVKIRFCVFFDGTLNNRTNVEERERNTDTYQKHKPKPGKAGNSYEGDKTNVAKMESYINKEESLGEGWELFTAYIEGPGTEDLKSDSLRGYAFGTGDTGVKEKVEKGIMDVLMQLRKKFKGNTIIEELVLDVFGFSRGAAGARYFIHKTLSDKNGLFSSPEPLADKIRAKGFDIDKKSVRVEFVGLYDTVSSEGLNPNDVSSLKLKAVGRSDVKTVIQLAAADEHRSKFRLTNIKSAGGRGKEIFLPGVHSDIGGGYRNDIEEDLILNESHDLGSLEKDRKHLLSQGWFKEEQIFIESPPALPPMASPYGEMSVPEPHRLKSRRTGLDNGYAKIPLHIMAELFCEGEVRLLARFKRKEKVPSYLMEEGIYDDLLSYAKGKGSMADDWHKPECYKNYAWLKGLRNQQLHFSAHCQRTFMVAVNGPNFKKGQRKRKTNIG